MFTRSRLAVFLAGSIASTTLATPFNDLADFIAAASDLQLVDFDTLPDGSPTVVGELGSLYADYGLDFPPGNFITDTVIVTVSPPHSWDNDTRVGQDIFFDVNVTGGGVRAFGVHNIRFGSFPNGAVLRAFDASGDEIELVMSDGDFETLDFFGVTTDADIARVTITVVNPMGWGLDDLYVGVGAACRADIDGDGSLTIFDFLAFQNAFDAGDPLADFDGDGVLTIFDFLAFQNEFDAGCG
ncbi:MAG: hypothetical protein NCW75_07265 [Phycisphaera sp.]|nr:MAG: hypothetical protein NCW75_07265 [Phycisphaera sp.]